MIKHLVTVVLSLKAFFELMDRISEKQAGAKMCQAQTMLKVIVGVKLELKLKLITISFEGGLVN